MTPFNSKNIKKASIFSILATFSIVFAIFLQTSCGKTEACAAASYTNDTNAAQNAAMVAYCTANNITYVTHPSGVLYQIISPGASTKPSLCETISMTYTGLLLNGTQFDKGTISYSLSQLIMGWQIAIPLIGKGGHIKILIPSSLAYGPSAVGSIPANSPLYFDVVLN